MLKITFIQLKVITVFIITYILCNFTCYNVDMLINKALSLCTCPERSGIYSAYIMCRINLISVRQLYGCNIFKACFVFFS